MAADASVGFMEGIMMKLREKMKRNRVFLVILTLAVLLGGMLGEDAMLTARADSASYFSIQAEMMSSDKQTYDIMVTVENQGTDWEGTVRLMVDETYRKPSAYDTVLSLPQGSKKQFMVKVPADGIEETDGTVKVTLLNKKSQEVAKKEFKNLLKDQMNALPMGILSDSYSELTYLDMGGAELFFYQDRYPIRLVELRQDNLLESLDSLTFLVIDRYRTDVLTDEELQAVELWVVDGGVLIIGTGAYVEDTLSAFDTDSMGIHVGEVYATGETEDYDISGYYDWSQFTVVNLQTTGNMWQDYYTGALYGSEGDGGLCIVPYSFSELSNVDMMDENGYYGRDEFVRQIIDQAADQASSRYSSSMYYSNYSTYLRRMLDVLGNSNSVLSFGLLKWIVILYVIFVGPVLYLILRLMKRRELYWVAVPVTAFAGIVLIFLAGRGFEVANTRVYSVTVENLSDSRKSGTYLYCYDAGHREWDLRMADGYEYAGPLANSYYYYDSFNGEYFYHFKKEGDILSLGINPGSNFEDSYFYAGGIGNRGAAEGTLLAQDVRSAWTGLSGTIINETDLDLAYFAVVCDDAVYVYENLPAGTACNLEDKGLMYQSSGGGYGSFYSSYLYGVLEDYYEDGEYDKASVLAALGVGLCDAYSQPDVDMVVVAGVVENWDKTVNDNCSEISYGCLYTIQ